MISKIPSFIRVENLGRLYPNGKQRKEYYVYLSILISTRPQLRALRLIRLGNATTYSIRF